MIIEYLAFPFKAVASLIYCLWKGIKEWRYVLCTQVAYLVIKRGKSKCITLEQWMWELDQEAEIPERGDSVSFWTELWGVVETRGIWDDNTLRFSVGVTSSPSQQYLRPYEIGQILRRKQSEKEGAE